MAAKKPVAPGRDTQKPRVKQWFSEYKWPLIAFMWLVAFALGYIGFSKHFAARGEVPLFGDVFYLTLHLFPLGIGPIPPPIGWELQIARFLAPAIAAYTAVQAVLIIFHHQLQLFRLRFLKDHIVICGLGRKGLILCKGFRENGNRVVVIEQDENNALLGQCRELGAIILIGDAADSELLRRARVHKAKSIISVCGDDGANAEVAIQAHQLVLDVGRNGNVLSCLVHIVNPQLTNLLRKREIMIGKPDAFKMELFNVFESGARIMLKEHPPFTETREDDGSQPHIVVVGVRRMGESLVANAARNWWEGRNARAGRLRISLIDREADKKKESLHVRYPQLEKVCELVSHQMDIQSGEFERAEFLFGDQGHCTVRMIYVCLDNDSAALTAALMLRQRTRSLEIPIVVRMTHNAGLATFLQREKISQQGFGNLHAFGLLDCTCTPDLIRGCTYEILASAFHESYIRHMREEGWTYGPIQDEKAKTHPSVLDWKELPESLKNSNRAQAEHIRVKLQAIGCDIDITTDWDAPVFEWSQKEVDLLAEMEHQRWVHEKESERWKYAITRDDKAKTHPALVTWKDLPEEERDKDRNSVRKLPTDLVKAGFQIIRLRKEG